VLIEAEPEYQEDIRRRMLTAAMGPEERIAPARAALRGAMEGEDIGV